MIEKISFRDFFRVLWYVLFAYVLYVFCFVGVAFADTYNVHYDCGFYSGTAPSDMTATDNNTFTTPSSANNCNVMSDATLTGWAVSGTEDVKTSGSSFTWEYDEDKTLSAVWSCYPNSDNTACVNGYKLELTSWGPSMQYPEPTTYPVPTALYSILTRGIYLDAARTKEMKPHVNGTGGQNPLQQIPSVLPYEVQYDTNAPEDPSLLPNHVQYYVEPVPKTEMPFVFLGFGSQGKYIASNGYVTSEGVEYAKTTAPSFSWASIAGWGASFSWGTPVRSYPLLVGYSCDGWYADQDGTGDSVTFVTYRRQFPEWTTPSMLYAHWTPKTYTISYNLNGGEFGIEHPTSADYDTDFSVSHPTRVGYTFSGWTITDMDSVTHYFSNNQIILNDVYQGATTSTNSSESGVTQTYFMNLRSDSGTVTFTANWIPNTINLLWEPNGGTLANSNPISCSYGVTDGISTIYQPDKPGYAFMGWLITNWISVPQYDFTTINLTGLTGYVVTAFSKSRYSANGNWYTVCNRNGTSTYCDNQNYAGYFEQLEPSQWMVEANPYGTLYGVSKCSGQTGDNHNELWGGDNMDWEAIETELDDAGGEKQNCWCKATGYKPWGQSIISEPSSPLNWVFLQEISDARTCQRICSMRCSYLVGGIAYSGLRSALLGQPTQ